MNIFKKRETPVQNLTFAAIMSAINCVILLLTSLQPYLRLLLTLSLPFASLLVSITCKKRYYPIYMAATIGLSFLVNFDGISSIIFYIVPSLLSGFIFGFCLENEIPSSYSILYSSLVYVICSYVNLLICNFVFNDPLEEFYFTLFNLRSFPFKNFLIPVFMFALGIIHSSLSYLFIEVAIKKVGIEDKELEAGNYYIYTLIFILLTIVSIFIKEDMYLMFVGVVIYTFIHSDFLLFKQSKKLFCISNLIALVSTFFAFGIFFNLIPHYYSIALLLVPIFIVVIIGLLNNCFVKRTR